MTLCVAVPPGWAPERAYAVDAVLGELLGLAHTLVPGDGDDVRIRPADQPDGRALHVPDVLFATSRAAWLTRAAMPRPPLARVRTRGGDELPVLYGRSPAGGAALAFAEDGARLAIDVFGSAFFMLTRYEEVAVAQRDIHGRFPAVASIASAEGFLRRPIVDEYAELLWEGLSRLWPALRRRMRSFRLALTYDVDHPWATRGAPVRRVLRAAAGDLVRRRDPTLAARRVAARLADPRALRGLDPYDTFDFILGLGERHGLMCTFYVMAHGGGHELDGDYAVADPRILRLIGRLHRAGHEIGLHASYASWRDAQCMQQEFARLRSACNTAGVDQTRWGNRQHFLRWENPTTWRNCDEAGLDYDASLAYADDIGFRTGTCHEYPTFDLRARRRLRLRERTSQIMDRTLFAYLGLHGDAAHAQALEVVAACRRHGGEAVVIWHNSSLAERSEREWYARFVAEIVP